MSTDTGVSPCTPPVAPRDGSARPPRVLTIAGSDSGGGAGVQADLRTFMAAGVHGCCAVTAVTAQNSVGVQRAEPLAPPLVAAQIDSVMSDIGATAAKTGMVASRAIIEAVADRVAHWRMERLVVDPVMVATSGDRLLDTNAAESMIRLLIPLATIVTPNLPEARALTGIEIEGPPDMREAARILHGFGARAVLIKGGHALGREALPAAGTGPASCDDLLFDGRNFFIIGGTRIATANTHGSGCTLSAAIAALLACGLELHSAVVGAKEFVTRAMRASHPVGSGPGPLNHAFASAPFRPLAAEAAAAQARAGGSAA